MKFIISCIALAALVFVVSAEPPPPNNYLPPNQQPSSQYGAPSQQQQYNAPQAPSNSYIPPGNSYIPPQQQPSQSYGAPSQNSAVYQQAPQQPQSAYGAPNSGGYGGGNNNNNDQYGSGEPARYNFEYNVQDYQSGNDFGHKEQREGDLTTGRYYVLLPDGRKQIVNYEADRNGYRPTITYEQQQQQGGQGGQQGGYNSNAQPNGGGY